MDYFPYFLSEFLGTFVLLFIGTATSSALTLKKTYNSGPNWVLVVFGWGFGVMCGVFVGSYSGAHLNPAITFGQMFNGTMPVALALTYFVAQLLGAMLGAFATMILYYTHFQATPKEVSTLGIFCTGPAIPNTKFNFLSEALVTFLFVFILQFLPANMPAGLTPLLVGFIVVSIGISFGGLTGYAINPTRDFGPRLAYMLFPVPNKTTDYNWGYAWIPFVGPIIGGTIAIFLATIINTILII